MCFHLITSQLPCIQEGCQEDAHELITLLIDQFTSSPHLCSPQSLNQVFYGKVSSSIVCQKCKSISTHREDFTGLQLDIADCSTIYGALDKYFRVDMLEGEDAYSCRHCQERTVAHKSYQLAVAPQVLTIQLKRFQYTEQGAIKVSEHISFDPILYLYTSSAPTPTPTTHFTYGAKKRNGHAPEGELMRYELVGLIEHQGDGLGSGHYIAICRRGDKWYEVDQDLVVEIDLPAVLNKQAYVLVYQLSMEGVEEQSAFIYTFASSEYYQPPALQHNGDWPRPFLNGQSNRSNPSMIVQNGNKNGKDSRFAQMKSPRHARKSYSNWSDDHMN